jgi:cytochrome c biogenesis protein CcmG/thiol:disulfide interchange protein DsbE
MTTEKNSTQYFFRSIFFPGFIVVSVISLLAILIYGVLRSQTGRVMIGSLLPVFTISTFDGNTINSAELQGKVVIINFWASWCNTCIDEADELQGAYEYFESNPNVVFIGIAYNDVSSNSMSFIERYHITFPNAPDLANQISAEMGVTGVPETYIYSQSGVLAAIQTGPYSSSTPIISLVEDLLDSE